MHHITKKVLILFIVLVSVFTSYEVKHALADVPPSTDSTATTSSSSSSEILPPTTPTWLELHVASDGVQISWGASQPGDFPLDHYSLRRSSDGVTYQEIAALDVNTSSYVDSGDHSDAWYEIVAVDNQSPGTESPPASAMQVPALDAVAISTNVPAETKNPTYLTPSTLQTEPTTPAAPVESIAALPSDPAEVDHLISQYNVEGLLQNTNDNTVGAPAPNDVALTAAHPLTVSAVQDSEVNSLVSSMDTTADMTVSDLPSLVSTVENNDSKSTVQTPDKRSAALASYSDSSILNVLNSILRGDNTLLRPALTRYLYEKTAVLQMSDRLSAAAMQQQSDHCKVQADVLNSLMFSLPTDQSQLALEGLAYCKIMAR